MTFEGSSYKRVLIKISGESLANHEGSTGVDPLSLKTIAQQIKEVHDQGTQVGLVIGAGNFFRGRTLTEELKIPHTSADEVGMIATCLNGLLMHEVLKQLNCPSQVYGSFQVGAIIQPYQRALALKDLEDQKVLIFVGGTAHPFFTTDSAASLRAIEIGAEALLKATKVDGVYDKDPKTHKDAKRFDQLTFTEVLEKDLKVLDATAISLCRDQNLPVHVFNMYEKGELLKVINKKNTGTLIHKGE